MPRGTESGRERAEAAPGSKPGLDVRVCSIDGICPRCGSQQVVSVKCKLLCQDCHAIVMTCCEF